MKLTLWVANDEPSGKGQDRILEVDRSYPCVPRQGDIVELVGSSVSGQVEKVTFDAFGRVTLHFTGSRLQVVSSDQSWHELVDRNFEKIPYERVPRKWVLGTEGFCKHRLSTPDPPTGGQTQEGKLH